MQCGSRAAGAATGGANEFLFFGIDRVDGGGDGTTGRTTGRTTDGRTGPEKLSHWYYKLHKTIVQLKTYTLWCTIY